MDAIKVQGLKRVYQAKIGVFRRKVKEVVAVDGIDFSVARGELFGLLGPNGAGKTTTIKMLTTVLIPTAGHARVLGYDLVQEADEIRPHVGFVLGGERGLYWRLSGYDNLMYFANLYHVLPDVQKRRIPYLLELVGLGGRGDEKVQGYSRGMKQRLHVARALLHDPQVLFLDEPTLGLDPVGARELRHTVHNLLAEEKTILLTTHYMFEADALCQRVAVINHGKIVALDAPAGLKRHVQDQSVVEVGVFGVPPEAVERIRALDGVGIVSVEDRDQRQVLRVQSNDGTAAVAPVVNTLEEMGLLVGNVVVREPTLEDAYVRLVGGKV
ncbi:MAG: ABC transporter ATP-binding protein [Chloroflexota bacterium]|nr:ABC transporter ATP-binding protein [Chloroflexota bacterium]